VSQPLPRGAKAVFFDFDGPLVRLFEHHGAAGIADRIFEEQQDLRRSDFPHPSDPHAVLARLPHVHGPEHPLVAIVEKQLTGEEILAARSPGEVEGATGLVRELHRRGTLLAITSNNSPESIQVCLGPGGVLEEIGHCFAGRIFGRDPDPRLMKPHPSCVERAVESVGLPVSDCLLIGDSVSDIQAARRARVPFLGFARTPDALDRLLRRDAEVVRSHADLLRVLCL
jgi:beta-phosphoglucomutase-like phosphatase (HAD superfamily)